MQKLLNSTPVFTLIAVFLVWRVALFLLAAVAPQFVEPLFAFSYAHLYVDEASRALWLHSWANFDGVHYITILQQGYIGTGYIQAFFPLYPFAARALDGVISNPFWSSLLVSQAATLALFLVWFWFVRSVYSVKTAWVSLCVLAVFPTAFYFGATYTESLFLLLVLATFWSLHLRKWVLAGVCIALASATRVVGIFLLPAAIIELMISHASTRHSLQTAWGQLLALLSDFLSVLIRVLKDAHWKIAVLLLGSTGLLAYMTYLQLHFQDPLYFLHVQSEFGAGRSEEIILLPQTIWRQLKILATVPFDGRWVIYLQELFFTLSVLGGLLYAGLKLPKMQLSWILFSLAAVLLPTTTGILSSMPRYVLVAFPIFIWIALWLERAPTWTRYAYFAISAMLLVFNLVRFIQGQWVS